MKQPDRFWVSHLDCLGTHSVGNHPIEGRSNWAPLCADFVKTCHHIGHIWLDTKMGMCRFFEVLLIQNNKNDINNKSKLGLGRTEWPTSNEWMQLADIETPRIYIWLGRKGVYWEFNNRSTCKIKKHSLVRTMKRKSVGLWNRNGSLISDQTTRSAHLAWREKRVILDSHFFFFFL